MTATGPGQPARRPAGLDRPGDGLHRRAVSPSTGGPLELVEVELPAGARVAFPAGTSTFTHHQIWVLEGHLRFREGDTEHELDAGDCLELGPAVPCAYVNPTGDACRYLVAVTRRPGSAMIGR